MFELGKVWFDGVSEYGKYRVVDMFYNRRPSRILYGNRGSPQSGLAMDESDELLFNYNQRFLEIAVSVNPNRSLVIGGGAHTFPLALLARFPNSIVDTVEIDPLVVDLSRRYFNLKNSTQHNTYTVDGRKFIDESSSRYDLIVVDAFSEYEIPKPLITQEAAHRYASLLGVTGVFTMNFISTYHAGQSSLSYDLLETFSTVFNHVDVYAADNSDYADESDNLILIASQVPANVDYLQSNPISNRSRRGRILRDIK